MITLNIKPLSVNDAWQGKRYKSKKYVEYEKVMFLLMPKILLPKGKIKVTLIFGINSTADIDNPIKPLLDIMQKKYYFDDKDILELKVKKIIVKTGYEYIKYNIESIVSY